MNDMIKFSSDMTLRWPCRKSDFLLWLRWKDIFSGGTLQIVDVWEMRDGDYVTITNRMEDLPTWFKLHPTEAAGILSYKMMALLNKGYQYPRVPLDGPNIWRPACGDRLVWIGETRNGQKSVDGILSIISFDNCALVLGDCNRTGMDEYISFGSLAHEEFDPNDMDKCRYAVELVKQMGIPRSMSIQWSLGS